MIRRYYLGVDPGVTGAAALLTINPDGTQALKVTPTPTEWRTVGKGRRRRYDIAALDRTLVFGHPIDLAYIEEQTSMPGQGVTSMLSIGFGEGMWHGLLTAHAIPFVVIRPQRWRKLVGLGGGPRVDRSARKGAVRVMAARRFPAVPIHLDHADAVMLAVAAALEHRADEAAEGRQGYA